MTAIPMTTDAMKGVRRELRRTCPDLKSAHATEALASALGFHTHASLLPNLDLRPLGDPDYAYFDAAQFRRRVAELSPDARVAQLPTTDDLAAYGAIPTASRGAAVRFDTLRRRAWRNAMVLAINEGIQRRLFTIRPGDNRWEAAMAHDRKEGAYYEFSAFGIPAIGYVGDGGYDELSIHVALWPSENGRYHVGAFNAGLIAGNVFASGWLERRNGAWLQVSKQVGTGATFASRRSKLHAVAELQVRPSGYADGGSFIL